VGNRAVPILASPDLNATLIFYQGLGFENRGAPPDEWGYMIIGRDTIELHFIGPSAKLRGPGSCFLFVEDADSVYDEWQAKAVAPARIEAPIDTDYGMREFTLFDPCGNEVRVGSQLALPK
jgi:catechol 2,3-dioxygenase-like lactoylglutathione lyase family enzyme